MAVDRVFLSLGAAGIGVLVGVFTTPQARTERAPGPSHITNSAITRYPSPMRIRWTGMPSKSRITRKRCSSTPRADTFVKSFGSMRTAAAGRSAGRPSATSKPGQPSGGLAPTMSRPSRNLATDWAGPPAIVGLSPHRCRDIIPPRLRPSRLTMQTDGCTLRR